MTVRLNFAHIERLLGYFFYFYWCYWTRAHYSREPNLTELLKSLLYISQIAASMCCFWREISSWWQETRGFQPQRGTVLCKVWFREAYELTFIREPPNSIIHEYLGIQCCEKFNTKEGIYRWNLTDLSLMAISFLSNLLAQSTSVLYHSCRAFDR